MSADAHPVTLIPGDGIGPEVTEAARRALEATGVPLDWDVQHAGAETFERNGEALPPGVLESIRGRRVALKGPTATPMGAGFRSVNLALRRALGLYLGIRPCRAMDGVKTAFPRTDLVVVRMITEDLYGGIEFAPQSEEAETVRELVADRDGAELPADSGITIKSISRSAAALAARGAFRYARQNGRSRVTAVHKATVMRQTDGMFLEGAREAAADNPEISFEEELVDTVCQRLVTRPDSYDVLLLPMLYGDIVSDIGAGLIGGLGMAPGVNLGDGLAVFEPVHGSAPRQAGRGRANPMAMMLSGAMLLDHLDEHEAARRLTDAVAAVVASGSQVTYDLKADGDDSSAAGTAEVTDAVIAELREGVG